MYINKESLIIDYRAGLTNPQLAKKHGCTVTTIRRRLIQYGIYKPQCPRKNKQPFNRPSPTQIQEWKEKAEKWDQLQQRSNS